MTEVINSPDELPMQIDAKETLGHTAIQEEWSRTEVINISDELPMEVDVKESQDQAATVMNIGLQKKKQKNCNSKRNGDSKKEKKEIQEKII